MKQKIKSMKLAIVALCLSLRNHRRAGTLTSNIHRRRMFSIVFSVLYMRKQITEMNRRSITVFYPSDGVVMHDAASVFWTDVSFEKMFRFRRPDFFRMLDAMNLRDKSICCGRSGRGTYFPADICFMVVLRRLAFPCRFFDMVNMFGIPSNRLCDIFHSTIDFLHTRYAKKLNEFTTWEQYFPAFAAAMQHAGAPYDNLISIFDGNCTACCRPGGLGNQNSRFDQSEVYTGEKAQHQFKYLVSQFPNGISVLSGPYKGKVHDGRMLSESGWTQVLMHIEHTTGRRFLMFGDAGFAVSRYIQAMYKEYGGYITADARNFNNLMSRIKIYIENSFAEKANIFSFMSFKNGLRLGGRRVHRAYEVANFLQNIRTTFYGNQFCHALNYPLRISVEEFLALA